MDADAAVHPYAQQQRGMLKGESWRLPDGSTVRAQAEQSLQSANRAGQLVRHLLRLRIWEPRRSTG